MSQLLVLLLLRLLLGLGTDDGRLAGPDAGAEERAVPVSLLLGLVVLRLVEELDEWRVQRPRRVGDGQVPGRVEEVDVELHGPASKDGLLRHEEMTEGEVLLALLVVGALGFELNVVVMVRCRIIRMLSEEETQGNVGWYSLTRMLAFCTIYLERGPNLLEPGTFCTI